MKRGQKSLKMKNFKKLVVIGIRVWTIFLCVVSVLVFSPVFGQDTSKSIDVYYFYQRDGYQNPEGSSGSPNWFYYWREVFGQNSSVVVTYNSNIAYGQASQNGVVIGDSTNRSFATPFNNVQFFPGCPRPTADGKMGIDLFFTILTHELVHFQDYLWIQAHPNSPDSDGDGLPDAIDPFPNQQNGGNLCDEPAAVADWEFKARQPENVIAPTEEDWACPGKQWSGPCN